MNLIDFNAARHVNADKNEDTRMLGTVYLLHRSSLDSGSLMSVRIYMVWEQQLIIL